MLDAFINRVRDYANNYVTKDDLRADREFMLGWIIDELQNDEFDRDELLSCLLDYRAHVQEHYVF
jgi:hypothetical protein